MFCSFGMMSILCVHVRISVVCKVKSNEYIFTTDFVKVPNLVKCIYAATYEVISKLCKMCMY